MKNNLIFLLLLSMMSCTKIENLSNNISLKSFAVVDHSPQSIILGDVKISADTVYLPIEYGKYDFPLTLEVEPVATAGAYIYGVSKDEPITFNSIDDAPLRFVVSAASGVSKNYYFSLLEIPLSESCELLDAVSFLDTDYDDVLLSNTLVDVECKMMIAVDAEYPLTITPKFEVYEATEIVSYSVEGDDRWFDFVNGETPLSFDDSEQYYMLEIISESGKSDVCKVGLSIVNFSEIDQTMQINYRELNAKVEEQDISINGYDIDFESGDIVILLDSEDDISFPLSITLNMPINEWLSLVGVSESQEYLFESCDDNFLFALGGF